MHNPSVPVDEGVATLAQRIFYAAVLLPTAAAVVVGLVAKITHLATRGWTGVPFAGMLSWIIVIGVAQLLVLAWGRWHYLAGVRLAPEPPALPVTTEPGIFYHATR
jgi:hypothetical protein